MSRLKNLTGFLKKKRPNVPARIMVTKGGRTSLDENYNRLKDNILYFGLSGKKVIQVEATIEGEGKTTLVSNLGVSLAFNDKKVVVLDLDFRNPGISKVFGLDEALGVSDYVIEDSPLESIIKHTEYNVDVITRGRVVYNSSVVLNSDKMKNLIEELKNRYDFILLDCPPVLLMSDYMHISEYADGILYTVAANFVKKYAVKESIALLSKLDIPFIGCVMTGVNQNDAFYRIDK